MHPVPYFSRKDKDCYYSQKLSAEKLRLCYEIAPQRVKQYLESEIAFHQRSR